MEPDQEIPYPRPLSGAAIKYIPSRLLPARVPLEGREVRLEPHNPSVHAAELFEASHGSDAAQHIWDYLPDGRRWGVSSSPGSPKRISARTVRQSAR